MIKYERVMKLKFFKGMIWGGLLSTGMWMMYNERMLNKNKMMKKGKQFAKNLGLM